MEYSQNSDQFLADFYRLSILISDALIFYFNLLIDASCLHLNHASLYC